MLGPVPFRVNFRISLSRRNFWNFARNYIKPYVNLRRNDIFIVLIFPNNEHSMFVQVFFDFFHLKIIYLFILASLGLYCGVQVSLVTA